MLFSEIVAEVCDSLNLTSTAATTRVGKYVNRRYRRVLSAIGLDTARREIVDQVVDPVTSPELPDVEIDVVKIIRVQLLIDGVRPKLLDEVSYDEITERAPGDATPTAWAVKIMDASTVTITLDNFPSIDNFTLRIEGYVNLSDLSGSNVPSFSADYHDILVEGAKADELRKMEKYDMANVSEGLYESKLSDLRLFIATSAYKDQQQGKYNQMWNWSWRYRR